MDYMGEGHESPILSSAESSRKRRRTNSSGQDIHDPNTFEPPVRDEIYYAEDADCVIRVGNTLFKVFRFLLTQDSSAFKDMFSIPGGDDSKPHGLCDEHPIVLSGDTPEQFRALCWVLYALPTEIQKQSTANADIQKLLDVAVMTNKYHFQSLESWATDAIFAFFSCRTLPKSSSYLYTCSADDLSYIIKVAVLCNRTDLQDLITDNWAVRLLNVWDPLFLSSTLRTSDQYGLHRLQGFAYYQQLLQMNSVQPIANTTVTVFSPPGLAPKHVTRLLSGYWSLSRYWERLSHAPPAFVRSAQCPNIQVHNQVCLHVWNSAWRVSATSPGVNQCSVAVVQRFLSFRDFFLKSVSSATIMIPCKMAALAVLDDIIKKTYDELADHFLCTQSDRI